MSLNDRPDDASQEKPTGFGTGHGFRPVVPQVVSPRAVQTREEYLAALENGERWIEMEEGTFLRQDPPDEMHGNIIRNLTAALGPSLKSDAKSIPCFELPLLLEEERLTIRIPAISFYPPATGFAVMDELMTTEIPVLVVEIASSRLRRDSMSARVKGYLQKGVQGVWVIDPVTRHVHQFSEGLPPKMIKETETMHGYPYFEDLHLLVMDLFADPVWLRSSGS
ncbi:Uma2 family endonuclease [Planctopirus hydrillae]|uniref:Putative restriction endonuclease domain-containing protein n=1 Tax=Planctopirus hydrillae TaxID=1841610 RepID=A0A1C3EL21_9PLAN|nr:Uma2 family endonuclease [Planctopirus hydrillae]ODA33931.1 hypothetical protein A6X21_17950 [Planctopirus hydrillae]